MKTFIEHDFGHCDQINGPSGRFYDCPDGNRYPSVTTVLGSIPNPHLDQWRKDVGDKVADEITQKAADNGSKLHNACEKTLLGQSVSFGMFDLDARDMYNHFKPHFKRIDNIHALESRLWCSRLKTAGSVDVIAEFDGELSVIDWKSSRRFKSKNDIHSYFMQCAAYAAMFYSRTGIKIKKIVVMMSTSEHGCLIFQEKVSDWLPEFISLRKQFSVL